MYDFSAELKKNNIINSEVLSVYQVFFHVIWK